MDGFRPEGWQTDGDVFGAFFSWGAVLNPFTLIDHNRFFGRNFKILGFSPDTQHPAQDNGEFIKFRSLARFFPALRTGHPGQADTGGVGIDPANKFFN